MTSSFWKNNSCVPSWIDFLKSYLYSQPARLIDPRPAQRSIAPFPRGSGLIMRRATPEDIAQLPEFWGRWYSVSKAARCVTPLEYIQKASWDILVCVKGDSTVVGSLVRRWVVGLHMREVRWPKAGLIDYFCIHPAYRSKGVGRALLSLLHNITMPVITPQLMMWEGLQPTIPPISAGLFMYKKCPASASSSSSTSQEQQQQQQQARKLTGAEASSVWLKMQQGNQVWNDYSETGEETSIWDLGEGRGQIAIWNTFHRSVPEGLLIGIIVGSTASASSASSASLPFGILLMPSSIHNTWALGGEGWAIDSPYQWVSYNTQFGTINTQFPGLSL